KTEFPLSLLHRGIYWRDCRLFVGAIWCRGISWTLWFIRWPICFVAKKKTSIKATYFCIKSLYYRWVNQFYPCKRLYIDWTFCACCDTYSHCHETSACGKIFRNLIQYRWSNRWVDSVLIP